MQMLTVIEERIKGKWYFFSQQMIKDGETPIADEEYLDACIRLGQTSNPLRIATTAIELDRR